MTREQMLNQFAFLFRCRCGVMVEQVPDRPPMVSGNGTIISPDETWEDLPKGWCWIRETEGHYLDSGYLLCSECMKKR